MRTWLILLVLVVLGLFASQCLSSVHVLHDDGTSFRRMSAQFQVVDLAEEAAVFYGSNRRWPSPAEWNAFAQVKRFSDLPAHDPWGALFTCSVDEDGNVLAVRSAGPDGAANTKDDVVATTWRATGGRLRSSGR